MQDFIKWMSILNIEENIYLDIEEKIIDIDSEFMLEYNQDNKKLFIYKYNHKNNENISFKDYISIWTIVKEFLISIWVVTEENKKDIFKIEKIFIDIDDKKPNIIELDTKIHKVPNNDIVLLKTLSMIPFNIIVSDLNNWLVSNKISFNKEYLKKIEESFPNNDKISFKLRLEIETEKISRVFIKTKETEYIIFE